MNKSASELNKYFSNEDIQMTGKYMKNCSMSLTFREMQMKTILLFHFTPVKMAMIKKTKTKKV
jgi:hypothetical protein